MFFSSSTLDLICGLVLFLASQRNVEDNLRCSFCVVIRPKRGRVLCMCCHLTVSFRCGLFYFIFQAFLLFLLFSCLLCFSSSQNDLPFIRRAYERDMESADSLVCSRGIAMYFLDRLGFGYEPDNIFFQNKNVMVV